MIYQRLTTWLMEVDRDILCRLNWRTAINYIRFPSINPSNLELRVDALADIETVLVSQAKLLQTASPLEELLRIRLQADVVFLEDREHWMECKGVLSIRVINSKYSNENARKIVEHTFNEINLRSKFKLC